MSTFAERSIFETCFRWARELIKAKGWTPYVTKSATLYRMKVCRLRIIALPTIILCNSWIVYIFVSCWFWWWLAISHIHNESKMSHFSISIFDIGVCMAEFLSKWHFTNVSLEFKIDWLYGYWYVVWNRIALETIYTSSGGKTRYINFS